MDRPLVQEMADTVIPVPLVIAVSGHRNLVAAEIPEKRRLTREFLETTRAHSGATPAPAAVLTPLAEGSGQLVAREALRLGLQLIVPLPMPKDLYRQGLASDADRREFDRLVSQAEVFELGQSRCSPTGRYKTPCKRSSPRRRNDQSGRPPRPRAAAKG